MSRRPIVLLILRVADTPWLPAASLWTAWAVYVPSLSGALGATLNAETPTGACSFHPD